MSKILEIILFKTVLIVITLHAIIPHPHSNELTEEKHINLHENSNSLLGIIRLAFHENDDENLDNLIFAQYESVKKMDSKHNYPLASILFNTTSITKKRTSEKITKSNTNNFSSLLFVKLNGLRGPPQLV